MERFKETAEAVASTSPASCTPPVPRRDHRLTSASTSTLGLSTREWGTVCTLSVLARPRLLHRKRLTALRRP